MLEVLLVLVILGYFTLLERKILGYGQMRKGPNKAVQWGLVQPLLDGVKLFMKGYWGLEVSGLLGLWGFPIMGLVVVLIVWGMVGALSGVFGLVMVMLFVVLLSGFVGTCFFVTGYFAGGKYSQLGSVRSLAQVVSYEGVLVMGLLVFSLWSGSGEEMESGLIFMGWAVLAAVVASVVMESNRTPVDYVEGESELVSGLATEMGGLSFSLLFLMEYGVMSIYVVVVSVMLWGVMMGWVSGMVTLVLLLVGLCVLRLSLPRSRYDLSMGWGWKVGLVVVFFYLVVAFAGMVVN
uniref:NADH-ubiquinone oxidoreductase chain 1 n=1 Tax=Centrorhynchus clitorideus TaxID=2731796 RepID=A0A6M3YWX1_9BILA|nr:NADH dehydrogenase subunit 1 [Centrorhynchus clitorideus]